MYDQKCMRRHITKINTYNSSELNQRETHLTEPNSDSVLGHHGEQEMIIAHADVCQCPIIIVHKQLLGPAQWEVHCPSLLLGFRCSEQQRNVHSEMSVPTN